MSETEDPERTKKVLLQAALDIEASAKCYYQHWFGPDEQSPAKVINFINKKKARLQFRADSYKIFHLQQYLHVIRRVCSAFVH
ncbi:MAG: hypothetical protein ACXWWC_10325 [Chitinophagaceae bacterium]